MTLALIVLFAMLAIALVIWPIRSLCSKKKRKKHQHQLFRAQFYFGAQRMANMQLKDSEKVVLSVLIEDIKGQVLKGAAFDAPPAWGLDDAAIGDLNVATDGMSAEFVPNGSKLGIAHVQFSALIGGKSFAATSEDLIVIAGDAAQVAMSVGAPVPQ